MSEKLCFWREKSPVKSIFAHCDLEITSWKMEDVYHREKIDDYRPFIRPDFTILDFN